MADYHPLLSRAVAALPKNSGENRRVIYDRARAALLNQLRAITPALPESDITRERLALEESIRKVEAESARQFVETARQSRLRAPEPRRDEPAPPRPYLGPPVSPPPERPLSQDTRQDTRQDTARMPPAMPTPAQARQSDLFGARRASADQPQAAAPRPSPVPRWGNERDDAFAPAEKSPREYQPRVPPADLDRTERPASRFDHADMRMLDRQAPQERMLEPAPASDAADADLAEPFESSFDDARPAAAWGPPPPIEEEEFEPADEHVRPRSYRGLVRGLAAVAVVIAVGGGLVWQWPNIVALYRSYRAPVIETARETPPATARPKITDRIEPGQQAPAAPSQQGAAQKVVLYEEDPADPNGRRFVGSAIWRTETVTPGPGQAPELAIRADVEVPERKLAMTWSLRRNNDKGLPATHTVEIMFKLPADFPAGGISNVPGILMKQAEQTRGVPLAGLAVKVTSGFYLIGLSNLDADRERNLQMLKERGWFDIPVVYNNNRRAILALEKGTPGEHAFADAFKAWKQ